MLNKVLNIIYVTLVLCSEAPTKTEVSLEYKKIIITLTHKEFPFKLFLRNTKTNTYALFKPNYYLYKLYYSLAAQLMSSFFNARRKYKHTAYFSIDRQKHSSETHSPGPLPAFQATGCRHTDVPSFISTSVKRSA